MVEMSFAVEVGGAYALAENRLCGVEPERMHLAYIFVPSGERVTLETEEGFLPRAEERVARALPKIRAGACDSTPSRRACSYCPVFGVGIEGCPMEIPIEDGEHGAG
jgi:DNA helicase II / ATP-dependent DNA helicase PcrA